MVTATDTFSGSSAYRARLIVTQDANRAGDWELWVDKLSGSGFFTFGSEKWRVSLGADVLREGTWDYDFRNYTSKKIASGTWVAPAAASRNFGGYVEMGNGAGSANAVATLVVESVPNTTGTPVIAEYLYPDVVTLDWDPPFDGNSELLEYQLRRGLDSSMANVEEVRSPSGSGANEPVPVGGTRYFQVRSRNRWGWGGWSGVRRVDMPAAPKAPTGLAVAMSGVGQATATWTNGDLDGRPLLENQVQWSTSSAFSGATTLSAGTASSDVLTGLPAADRVYVRVRSRTTQGWGAWSATQDVYVPTVPSAPARPTFGTMTSSGFTVNWVAPADGGASITGYDVELTPGDVTSQGTSTSKSFTGLSATTDYSVRVRAKNSQGAGPWSPALSPETPTPPSSVSLTFAAPSTLNVSWSGADLKGRPILEYQVQYDDASGFTSPTTLSAGTSTTDVISGLPNGVRQYVRVRTRTSSGWSAWSSSVNYAVPNVPSKPATPTVSDLGAKGFKVSWTAPANNGASITGYDVLVTPGTTTGVGSTTTSRTYSDQAPGTDYTVRVRAKNSQGAGAYSDALTFRTLSGAYWSDGTTWEPCVMAISDGTAWLDADGVYVSDGTAWAAAE